MNYLSVGDMAQSYQMRRHNAQLKQTMNALSEELTTGVQSNLGKAVKGDFRALSSIDASLDRIASYTKNADLATIYTSSMQSSLEQVQNLAATSGASLLSASSDIKSASFDVALQEASRNFDSAISALNTKIAGRYVFSGTSTSTQPLASSDTILSSLETAINGLTTSGDISTAIDAWFDAPQGSGGFMDIAFSGSTETVAGLSISDSQSVDFPATAASQEIRDTLKGLATAALVARGSVPDDDDLRVNLVRGASEQLIASDSALSELRGVVGTVEEQIATAQTSNESEKSSLSIAKNKLIGIDEYDTATALEAVQTQLETLYTLTSRLTQLSLTDYL